VLHNALLVNDEQTTQGNAILCMGQEQVVNIMLPISYKGDGMMLYCLPDTIQALLQHLSVTGMQE